MNLQKMVSFLLFVMIAPTSNAGVQSAKCPASPPRFELYIAGKTKNSIGSSQMAIHTANGVYQSRGDAGVVNNMPGIPGVEGEAELKLHAVAAHTLLINLNLVFEDGGYCVYHDGTGISVVFRKVQFITNGSNPTE